MEGKDADNGRGVKRKVLVGPKEGLWPMEQVPAKFIKAPLLMLLMAAVGAACATSCTKESANVKAEEPTPAMAGTTESKDPAAVNLKTKQDIQGFQWLHEPKTWSVTEKGLLIAPDKGSDFWQRTHYGFRNDNAHFFYKEIEGDFEMYAAVSFDGKHRYDQAGLCVRLDEDNWIKTSAEYETEKFSHLGAVVTNLGYSDWSTQEIPADIKRLEYKIVRKGQDFEVYARFGGKDFQQIRIAHLHKNESKVKAGMYACSPTEGGYSALFTRFELKGAQK